MNWLLVFVPAALGLKFLAQFADPGRLAYRLGEGVGGLHRIDKGARPLPRSGSGRVSRG